MALTPSLKDAIPGVGQVRNGGAIGAVVFGTAASIWNLTDYTMRSVDLGPITFTDAGADASFIPRIPPVKIALGTAAELPMFSLWVQGIPWYGSNGVGWGTQIRTAEQMALAIKVLGTFPNVTFHFNLTSSYGRVDRRDILSHFLDKKAFTSIEYQTIMSDPSLRAKTTFYERTGAAYNVTAPTPID